MRHCGYKPRNMLVLAWIWSQEVPWQRGTPRKYSPGRIPRTLVLCLLSVMGTCFRAGWGGRESFLSEVATAMDVHARDGFVLVLALGSRDWGSPPH